MIRFKPFNVRKMFLPDPGYLLVEPDLERADAQVVAWEADDTDLKRMFREGVDIHYENAKLIFNTPNPEKWQREQAKVGVHGVNYGCEEDTLSEQLRVSKGDARQFIRSWFVAHPGILGWHRRITWSLSTSRTVSNPFGFRRIYLHLRPGPQGYVVTPDDLHKALAWIPQSVVGYITHEAMRRICREIPEAQHLLENHDANLWQVPLGESCYSILDRMSDLCRVTVPYSDPLIIPVGLKVSPISWGHMQKLERINGSFAEGLDRVLHGVHGSV